MACNPDQFQLVLTTCETKKQAKMMAGELVKSQLAACVNIITKAQSVYLWKGEVVSEKECLLIIKTRTAQFSKVQNAIETIHPYELPEIIAVPLKAGSSGYLDWLDECIKS